MQTLALNVCTLRFTAPNQVDRQNFEPKTTTQPAPQVERLRMKTHSQRRTVTNRPPNVSRISVDTEDNTERALRITQMEVSFIHSTEFEQSGAQKRIVGSAQADMTPQAGRLKAPADVPAHLAHLWEVALLKPEEERQLFRRMNFQKYRVNSLRSRLTPSRPNARVMDQIEQCLADAGQIRNHIVQANLRLVVSIARKFVNDAMTLDELTSDGNLILMKAAESFDYSRGFRFSTYATHAVQREFYRSYAKRRRRRWQEVATDPDVLFQSVEASEGLDKQLREAEAVEYLKGLMAHCLDSREYEIVDRRFGLNADDGGQTLREVGDSLQISKERVRQIQTRAIEQLRQLAVCDPDDQR